MENLIKRFVKYAKVHTTSNEDSETVPSTEIQKNLGKILVEDLKEIGLSDAYMDDKGYVYATLKSNTDKNAFRHNKTAQTALSAFTKFISGFFFSTSASPLL